MPMRTIHFFDFAGIWTGGRSSKLRVRRAGLFLIVLVTAVAFLLSCRTPSSFNDPTPIDITAPPNMKEAPSPEVLQVAKKGYTFTIRLKAAYVVRGIVVSREEYGWDWNALLSPMDVALCWGNLARGDLYKKLAWSQNGRWYFWQPGDHFPYNNEFIARHSSNSHIIPATSNLARALKTLQKGDHVEMTGHLVDVDGRKDAETYRWHSSMSPSDRGEGSCEIIYVERLKRSTKVFE